MTKKSELARNVEAMEEGNNFNAAVEAAEQQAAAAAAEAPEAPEDTEEAAAPEEAASEHGTEEPEDGFISISTMEQFWDHDKWGPLTGRFLGEGKTINEGKKNATKTWKFRDKFGMLWLLPQWYSLKCLEVEDDITAYEYMIKLIARKPMAGSEAEMVICQVLRKALK